MKKLQYRDKKVRSAVKQLEAKKQLLQMILDNKHVSRFVKGKVRLKNNSELLSNSSKTRITNRCILTNRKKRVNKYYNLSRLVFIRFMKDNSLRNLQKICW